MPDTQHPVRSVARVARLSTGSVAASVFSYRSETGEAVLEVSSGEGEDVIEGRRLPAAEGIVGWVLRTGEPVLAEDVPRDARFARGFARSTGYVPRVIAAAPVLYEDRIVGVIEALDPSLVVVGQLGLLELLSELGLQAGPAVASVSMGAEQGRSNVARRIDSAIAEMPEQRALRVIDAFEALVKAMP